MERKKRKSDSCRGRPSRHSLCKKIMHIEWIKKCLLTTRTIKIYAEGENESHSSQTKSPAETLQLSTIGSALSSIPSTLNMEASPRDSSVASSSLHFPQKHSTNGAFVQLSRGRTYYELQVCPEFLFIQLISSEILIVPMSKGRSSPKYPGPS